MSSHGSLKQAVLVRLDEVRKEVSLIGKPRGDLPAQIETQDQVDQVASYRNYDNQALAKLELMRKTIVSPFNDAVRKTNQLFRDMSAPFQARKVQADRLILAYSTKQQALAEKTAAKEAKKYAKKGLHDQAEAVLEQASGAGKIDTIGLGVVERIQVEVLDATKVPAYQDGFELRTISQSALNKLGVKLGEGGTIPGCIVKWVKSVRGVR